MNVIKNLGLYDIPSVYWMETIDGVLFDLSSNQIHIAISVHQMEDTHLLAQLLYDNKMVMNIYMIVKQFHLILLLTYSNVVT